MTRAVLAAQAGWGKSWLTQWWAEDNLDAYDHLVVADYKDEYRGLVKADLAAWMGIGETEAQLSAAGWRNLFETEGNLVLARAVTDETWRKTIATVYQAARSLDGSVLIVIDEAHFIAPQRQGYPDAIKSIATTGRGEGVSSMWVTQRLTEIDETVLAQANARLLGGFTSDRDLSKVGGIVDYPKDVHNPQHDRVAVPDAIDRDGRPVEAFTDAEGRTIGSEWIYSTTGGDRRRINSRDLSMTSTHYGAQGNQLTTPG